MTMVNQLLKAKGRGYFSVRPDETVYSAIKKMGRRILEQCSSWIEQRSSAS
jgi:hypothetical protein